MPRTARRRTANDIPATRRPPHPTARPTGGETTDGAERLQKVLAAAGLGSRRQCEQLIVEGRVEVDRRVVVELGAKVDPRQHDIRVDGLVLPRPKLRYVIVNKPPGVVSTSCDPAGRTRVIDLLPPGERLFTVGRLDMSSEGLMLLTNDGELANRLTHPRYGVEKTYLVEVAGVLEFDDLAKIRKGVYLAEGFARPADVRLKSKFHKSTALEIVLNEGRNREIRRLLARIGHKVLRLKRVAIGGLRLGELAPGEFRPLSREEVRSLTQPSRAGAKKRKRDKQRAAQSRTVMSATATAASAAAARPRPPGRTLIGTAGRAKRAGRKPPRKASAGKPRTGRRG